jgi:hypothetical protein
MIEEQVEIRTADGTVDGFLYRHEGGSRPGVIHLTDIGGIRSSQKAMASRLAAALRSHARSLLLLPQMSRGGRSRLSARIRPPTFTIFLDSLQSYG